MPCAKLLNGAKVGRALVHELMLASVGPSPCVGLRCMAFLTVRVRRRRKQAGEIVSPGSKRALLQFLGNGFHRVARQCLLNACWRLARLL